MTQDLRLAAQGARRQLEALARRAEVPLRSRVVRDEPLRALSIACAESGPWNVVALAEPFTGNTRPTETAAGGGFRRHRPRHGRPAGTACHRPRRRRRGGHADRLPALLRAAERLTALDGAEIVLLLIAPDEEGLDRMDGEVRLVVEAREDVRIEIGGGGTRRGGRDCGGLAAAERRIRHLPVRRPRRAGRGRPQAAGLGARVSAVPRPVDRVSRFQAAADFSHQNRYMFSNRNGFSSSNAAQFSSVPGQVSSG